MNKSFSTKDMVRVAMIAAVYTAVSFVPGLSALVFGPIQIRFAETLTMIPLFYQPGILGVTLGCFVTNLIGTSMGLTMPLDIFLGTLATYLAAQCTWMLRKKIVGRYPVYAMLMPVVFNFVIVGAELAWMLAPHAEFVKYMLIFGAEVALGEIVAVLLGVVLCKAMNSKGVFEQ